jgi:transcriptional regulator with PAS, ATPase and Fis domain
MFSDTLFGHKKGAYTGADMDREGLIVQASGGTFLLDEIGDLNESSQVKLLRLLEEKTYYPLGSDKPEKSNARIIVCSNQDIQKQIVDGKFRRDLYYRLCTHQIHITPLRDHLEDVPLLLDFFIENAALSQKKKKPAYPGELVILLSNYNFPGNVRELKAMVFDAVAQHKSGMLSMDSFKLFIKQKGAFSKTGFSLPVHDTASMIDIFGHFPTLKETEDHLISDALKRSDGNQGIAASLLGIQRQALNRRLKRKAKSS